jgi:hypothetical protein
VPVSCERHSPATCIGQVRQPRRARTVTGTSSSTAPAVRMPRGRSPARVTANRPGWMQGPASDGAARSAGEVTSHWGRNRANWSPMVRSKIVTIIGAVGWMCAAASAYRRASTSSCSRIAIPRTDVPSRV